MHPDMYAVVKESHNRFEFSRFHETLEEAKEEAERLARKENACFYVMKVVGKAYVEQYPVKWVEL